MTLEDGRRERRIVSDWVAVLEQECVRSLQEKGKVVLDFSAVFIDGRGAEMLKRIATEHLQMVNCLPRIEDLLRAGGDEWTKPEED